MISVFGASGFLGSYLFDYLKKKDRQVVGTYLNHAKVGLEHFDLLTSGINTLELVCKKSKVAVLCTGETSIDIIKKTSGHCTELNVTKMISLIDDLVSREIMPIYISTDCVFDGAKGDYVENDLRYPQTIYGQQKVAVEDHLINTVEKYLIVRISKIYSEDFIPKNYIGNWVKALINGQSISCATDQVFCPTHVLDVVRGIEQLLELDVYGIYHLANLEKYSKFDLGLKMCEWLGVDKGLINPVKINELGLLEERPLNTSLKSDKFVKATGCTFIAVEKSVQVMKARLV